MHEVFHSFTPLVEPLSLDEAFLDVTGSRRLYGDGVAIGTAIRARIAHELHLSCSVGVAPIKFVAKMASEAAKPKATSAGVQAGRGVVAVTTADLLPFLHEHPIGALWGVGPKTRERLERLGISTIGDLAAFPTDTIVRAVGRSSGEHLVALANGIDDRRVEPDRDAKSVGHEQTYSHDLVDADRVDRELVAISEAVATRLRKNGVAGRTVQLKVRFGDFTTFTRSQSVTNPVNTGPDVLAIARRLLASVDVTPGVRLLGVSASNLTDEPVTQLSLLDGEQADWGGASATIDEIRRRFGSDAIGPARLVSE